MNKILGGVLLAALLLIAGAVMGYGLAERRARWVPTQGPAGWPVSATRLLTVSVRSSTNDAVTMIS